MIKLLVTATFKYHVAEFNQDDSNHKAGEVLLQHKKTCPDQKAQPQTKQNKTKQKGEPESSQPDIGPKLTPQIENKLFAFMIFFNNLEDVQHKSSIYTI